MEPFIGSNAIRSGRLTRRALARDYRTIHRDVYLSRSVEMTAQIRAHAAWLSTGATLCGPSAAAILGTKWLDPTASAEVIRADRHAPPGIIVRSWRIHSDGVCEFDGIVVTTPSRTAYDLGRTLPLHQAVPMMDALLNATRLTPGHILPLVSRYEGARGLANLRMALALIDGGAESPQESRLRMLVVNGGLPRPVTQIEFRDLHIRVDMGWPAWKVAVEYDGVQHWADARQRAWDIERIALLEAAGWFVIRVSADMLRRPGGILERVRAALRGRGCPV